MPLVDTHEEQQLLEEIIERTKPPVPPECRALHYLLSTPFRYGAPYPGGSRFRRAGLTPGVFYASATVATAVAEMAFRRLLFFAESPSTPWPVTAAAYTAFAVRYRTASGLDLAAPPFDRQRERWRHPTDYAACHQLADAARVFGVQVIRYESARAPGRNVALLTCRAFASREPFERQSWHLHLGPSGARAVCSSPAHRVGFDRQAFAADPRIAALNWDREPPC